MLLAASVSSQAMCCQCLWGCMGLCAGQIPIRVENKKPLALGQVVFAVGELKGLFLFFEEFAADEFAIAYVKDIGIGAIGEGGAVYFDALRFLP